MANPEYEKLEFKDASGFSEKQLDMNVETGVFKSKKSKKVKKILFEKKSEK